MSREEVPVLNIVVKADMQGSAEAICDSLVKLSTDDVKVKIVGQGVGGINETDVTLAMASRALLIGFNVRADAKAKRVAEDEGVEIHYFSIIYDLIDLVRNGLTGLLRPEIKEQIVGLAQVRDVFRATKYGSVAGCMVIEGSIKRHLPVRVLRNNVVIFEGEIDSLRRFKDDVNEVRHGIECGIGVKNYNDIKAGDQIEVYEKISVARKL
jgi:translation initiation factor IF-2